MSPTPRPFRRYSLTAVAPACVYLFLGSGTGVRAALWDGSDSTNWNTGTNWDTNSVPGGQNAIINTSTGNIATITVDPTGIPSDVVVGDGINTNGRVNHTGGLLTTSSWFKVGHNGGTGVYNLAGTGTGGTYTGLSQGSGSITVGTFGQLRLGGDGGNTTGNGTLNVNTSGTITVNGGDIVVGGNGSGTLNLDNGTINRTNGGVFRVGQGSGVTGLMRMSGGTVNNTGEFWIGNDAGSNGTVTIGGGILNQDSWVSIGRNGGSGVLNVSGGTVNKTATNSQFVVGDGTFAGVTSTGTLNQTGGTINVAKEFWIGQGNGVGSQSTGTVTVSNGALNVNSWLAVGRNGASGTLTISGGTVDQGITDSASNLELTNFGNGGSGTVNLNGGILTVNGVTHSGGAGGTSTFNFNGGTLRARKDNATFLQGLTNGRVRDGGGTIDTQGFSISIAQSLFQGDTGIGILRKIGTGTLTLAGSGDNSGTRFRVESGTLLLGKDSNSGVHSVGSGGGTDYALQISGGTAKLGGTGGDQIYQNSSVNLTGGTLDLAGLSEGFDGLYGNGGTITNSVASTTSTLTLGQNNSAGSPVYSGVIQNGAGTVALVKTGSGTQTLSGANTYSGGTSINSGTLAIGHNTALGSGTVALNEGGTLATNASALTLANAFALTGTTNGATFTGSQNLTLNGAINYATGAKVTKTGSSVLTITSDNSGAGSNVVWNVTGGNYNSTTGLYDNVLAINSGRALGNGTGNVLNLNGGTLRFTVNGGSGYFSSRTINVLAGGGAIDDGGFAFGEATPGGNVVNPGITIASGATLNLVSSNQLVLSGLISGNGAIAKFGNGTLTLGGANTYAGNTTVNAGTLKLGANEVISDGTGKGNVTLNGTLDLNGFNETINGLTGGFGGSVTLSSGNTLTVGNNNAAGDFSGAFTGAGNLTKIGTGTLILRGTSTFTGITTISGGTLQISANGTTATLGSGNIVNNAALVFNRQNEITVGNLISGTGSVSQTGTGTMVLTNANTYTGATNASTGTLRLTGSLSNTAISVASGATFSPTVTTSAGLSSGSAGASLTLNSGSTLDMSSAGAGTINTFTLNPGSNSFGGQALNLSGANLRFDLGGSSADRLQVNSGTASVSGMNNIRLTTGNSLTTGTYTLIGSTAGGLAGNFQFDGGSSLSIPALSQIKNVGGTYYRLTLQNSGTAQQVVVTAAPANVINIMPLGSSITEGISSEGSTYSGGGYRSQLYQALVNDGRFTPHFVGSNTALNSGSAGGYNVLSGANELNHEGHAGYTTSQIMANLSSGAGWLAAGNGVNPNYVTLSIGGNDFGASGSETTGPINRTDAIVSQIQSLRPESHVILSNLFYRTQTSGGQVVGDLQNTYYNPFVEGVVFNHVLAGHNVSFNDAYSAVTPGNNMSTILDGIHPTTAGYNAMGSSWYDTLANGSAYWTGAQDTQWSTVNGSATNFAQNRQLTTGRATAIGATTDVYFNSNGSALNTTLGQNLAARSLNFAAGATGAVNVGGAHTLTLGAGGITVQAGTGAHTVSSNIALGADQTWGNVSSNALTVSGAISGNKNLAFTGSYSIQVATGVGNGTTTQTVSGTGAIVLTGANSYTGSTTIRSGTLQIGNGGATGSLATSSAITNQGTLVFNRSNAVTQGTHFSTAAIAGSGALVQAGTGTLELNAANTYTGTTTVNAGTLKVTGSIASSAVTVNNAGSVIASGATGTLGSSLTLNTGTVLAAGGAAAAGTATVLGTTTLNNGSIFSWDVNSNGAAYDKLVTASLAGEANPGDAIFRIVAEDASFANGFWSQDRTWTDIFTTNGSNPISNWGSLFSIAVVNDSFQPFVPAQGSFSLSGSTLSWSAVPEVSNLLIGGLVGAGLLRRRRARVTAA